MNCASSSTNRAASANSVTTSQSALPTGFLRVMQSSALSIAMTPKTQKKARLFTFRIRGVPQRRYRMGLRGQPLQIVDEAVARVLRVLVVHAHVDRLFRAHLLAVAAEDAAEFVDLVNQRVAMALFVLAGDELDAVGGTDLRAQPARHALRASLLVGEHPVGAAPARGQRPVLGRLLLRILHRHLGAQQMAERERHALERGAQVRRLLRRPFHDLHADRHYAAVLSSRGIEPDTMRPRSTHHTSATSISTFKPPSAHAIAGPNSQPSCIRMNQIATARTVI